MTKFSILQISDTHLSPRTEHFRENNRLLTQPLVESEHDFIIHTGDITLDGIRYDEDYALCRDFFKESGKTIHFLAGNHDIGDNPKLSKPESENGSAINAARYEKFANYFGPDYWVIDRGSWRIIGISSMLIGSGLARKKSNMLGLTSKLPRLATVIWQSSPISRCILTIPTALSLPIGPLIRRVGAALKS